MAVVPTLDFTDGSGSIAVGGTAQDAFAKNAGRQYLLIQNISATALWVDFNKNAVQDQPSIRLDAGASLELGSHSGVVPTGRVSVNNGTGGAKFVAKQA